VGVIHFSKCPPRRQVASEQGTAVLRVSKKKAYGVGLLPKMLQVSPGQSLIHGYRTTKTSRRATMKHFLRLRSEDGQERHLPVRAFNHGTTFIADQPPAETEITLTELHLESSELKRSLHISLGAFTLVEGSGGWWQVSYESPNSSDEPFNIEYVATHQFGEKLRAPFVTTWDPLVDEMAD
jgi:hypothetical protein